jgi:DNA recombination protein RmuC
VESLRSDVRSSLQHITESVNQQLSVVANQIQAQSSAVGSRLDNASRVIGDVQRNLGEMGQTTRELKDVGQSVSKLEELLRAPKLGGGLGEYILEDLLKQVFPSEGFRMQHRFRNGQIIDAVVCTSDRLTPIDSKFPNAHKKYEDVNRCLSGFEGRLTNLTDQYPREEQHPMRVFEHEQLVS